jgi:hypothetical protein
MKTHESTSIMKPHLDSILSTRPDPLDVLKTTAYVVDHAKSVRINLDAVARAADALAQQQIAPPAWNYDYHYFDGTPRSVNYLFLLDTLNFCFWGQPRWKIEYNGQTLDGYWALAASLKRAIEQNPEIAEGAFLAHITPQQLKGILLGKGEIPLFAERWRNVRELGTMLQNLWEGDAARLVECADHDAARLAQIVIENLSSFNDIAVYDDHEVRLFKRAQILVTDLWGAFRGKDWGEFENISVLTAFADYKLPQILRAWGVMRYAGPLARKIDHKLQIPAGSPTEIEIRAATLWAVEFLRQALKQRGRALESVQVDWILWNASQGKFAGIKPYHHTRTIYY